MKLRITVHGKAYDVEVDVLEDDGGAVDHRAPVHAPPPPPAPVHVAPPPVAPAPAPPPPAPAPPAASSGGKACKAPVPGTVLRVNVKAGDTVSAGQTLVVLEAMKMETNVDSPFAGRVVAVKVAVGEAVKQNQALVEFE